MKENLQITAIVLAIVLLGGLILGNFTKSPSFPSLGSTGDGQAYVATSTRNFAGTALANFSVLRAGPSIFGSVVITGANTGEIRFYDATTTSVLLRTDAIATSSLPTFIFPASLAVGTYVLDANLDKGLVYELVSGVAPTSTILYR